MRFSIGVIIWVILNLIIIFSFLVPRSFSNPRTTGIEILCGSPTRESSSNDFVDAFSGVLEAIYHQVKNDGYGYTYSSSPWPEIYIMGQCHVDLSPIDCQLCFSSLKMKAFHCLPATSGRLYNDGCFVRYDNYSFFEEDVDAENDRTKCSSFLKSDGGLSRHKVGKVVEKVTNAATRNNGFGAVELKEGDVRLYALAQCWTTVDKEECTECLDKAEAQLKNCSPATEGRAFNTGCYMRYSTDRFFSHEAEPNVQHRTDNSTLILGIVLTGLALTVILGVGSYFGYKSFSKRGEEKSGWRSTTTNLSSLNFRYEVLEKATDFFDDSRKLGEGGAGSVFRGTLPDGRNVAVKRLYFNSRQWVDQFFNEVNLISGIQHKNLIRLLGCSIEGPESLLVYEYVPNRSLDQILFMKNTIHILSWQQRFNIICGTAEGLAYLHEGSGTKIIHRDIKTSNILLDEKLTPKIGDFGLARCLGSDKSHLSTGIAGTLGYMAPEYLVRGQLTEKADVYSFGVLVIEVVSGRKNTVFSEGSSSVLHNVWKHYKAKTITNSVDPSLRGRFPEDEAARVLQVGLLCTQSSIALRPSMPEVVMLLIDANTVIPSPKQPPFLNASVLSPADHTRSSLLESAPLEGQMLIPPPLSPKSTAFKEQTLVPSPPSPKLAAVMEETLTPSPSSPKLGPVTKQTSALSPLSPKLGALTKQASVLSPLSPKLATLMERARASLPSSPKPTLLIQQASVTSLQQAEYLPNYMPNSFNTAHSELQQFLTIKASEPG